MVFSSTMRRRFFILLGVVVLAVLLSQLFLSKSLLWVGKRSDVHKLLTSPGGVGTQVASGNVAVDGVKKESDEAKFDENKKEGEKVHYLQGKEKVVLAEASASLPKITCEPGVPCEYNDEVDLRVIVMVFNRPKSLAKVLHSLQSLELDGDSGVLEIWIDRSAKTGEADTETVKCARQFKWRHGPRRVNVQKTHVGIYGQWIDTWRPKEHSKEIALFLEDDVDVSPYAYRWLKAAINTYSASRLISSYSLFEGAIYKMNEKQMPVDHIAFLHQRMGSQGVSPDPDHWRDFQDWFHEASKNKAFNPYVKNDPAVTSWYKALAKKNKANTMWTLWFIYFNDKRNLWTLYPNLGKIMHIRDATQKEDQYLAFHRQESGLHFRGKGISSKMRLITAWHDYFVEFPSPESLRKYSYHGRQIK